MCHNTKSTPASDCNTTLTGLVLTPQLLLLPSLRQMRVGQPQQLLALCQDDISVQVLLMCSRMHKHAPVICACVLVFVL